MMLKPVGKRVLIQGVIGNPGNLILTQKPTKFLVIAIGDDVTKVKPDDIIFLEKHFGVEIDHEKEKYLVIDEGSILAKLD
jgi:co-chaperonin GroES (HSP10)